MKKIKITRTYEGYSDSCSKCGKLIEAVSQDHVNYLMELHMAKHSRKKVKGDRE